ncbi:hypothetical protein NL676_007646 [Syzygium grande]|nr:hypothetical protein NL676_007646 [Syzygium grande]
MFVPLVIIRVAVGFVRATVTTEGHQCAMMGVGGRPSSVDAGGHRCALMGAGGRPMSADAGGHHRCATMAAGGRPTSADAGGHRCAKMGAGGQPTSADAGDLVTRGVATYAMMKAPLHRGCYVVVITKGDQRAAMPATSAKVSACLCKPSFVALVETWFSFL